MSKHLCLLLLIVFFITVQCDVIPSFFIPVGKYGKSLKKFFINFKVIFLRCYSESDEATKFYYLSKLKGSWIESHLICKSFGMNLLSIESHKELDFIKEIYVKFNKSLESHTYIGGTNLVSGKWQWIGTGKEFDLSLSVWHENGPNGQDSNEFCTDLHVSRDKEYKVAINDVPCASSYYSWDSLCERVESKERAAAETVVAILAIILSFCFAAYILYMKKFRKSEDDEISMLKHFESE